MDIRTATATTDQTPTHYRLNIGVLTDGDTGVYVAEIVYLDHGVLMSDAARFATLTVTEILEVCPEAFTGDCEGCLYEDDVRVMPCGGCEEWEDDLHPRRVHDFIIEALRGTPGTTVGEDVVWKTTIRATAFITEDVPEEMVGGVPVLDTATTLRVRAVDFAEVPACPKGLGTTLVLNRGDLEVHATRGGTHVGVARFVDGPDWEVIVNARHPEAFTAAEEAYLVPFALAARELFVRLQADVFLQANAAGVDPLDSVESLARVGVDMAVAARR